MARVDTRSVRCLTSARRESIEPEGVTADTLGGAMSTNLSASSAISSRVLSAADEASTVRTFVGRRWRKSSRMRGPSAAVALSPSNCRIRRSSCVGLRSPNSKELESALLGGTGSLDELLLECVVWVVWHVEDDVAHFGGELW